MPQYSQYSLLYVTLMLICGYARTVPLGIVIFCGFFWLATRHNGYKPIGLCYDGKEILSIPSEVLVSLIATLFSQCIQALYNLAIWTLRIYVCGTSFTGFSWIPELLDVLALLGDYMGCFVASIPFSIVNEIAYKVSIN